MPYKYLFGPVRSRRLGLSLGIDLVPPKICSMDCIYCEIGKTKRTSSKRAEYIRFEKIRAEIDDFFKKSPELDYITFSGAGEPTLNSCIGQVIRHIKKFYPGYRICLITNSSTMNIDELRHDLLQVDLLLPSLDAASQETFEKINRPDAGLKVKEIIEGLINFRKEFKGQIWLELFLVEGVNDSPEEIELLKEAMLKIAPERVQLNSLDRPGTEDWVKTYPRAKLEQIRDNLSPLKAFIIEKALKENNSLSAENIQENEILSLILRRPSTREDILQTTSINAEDLSEKLQDLIEKGLIEEKTEERGIFYKIRE